jgi:hypothetical protein
MRPVENTPAIEGGGIKENNGGDEPVMINCKNFCKCHNVFPGQQ